MIKRYLYPLTLVFVCTVCACSTPKRYVYKEADLTYREPLYPYTERYTRVNGTKICYIDEGPRDKDVLFFVNGLTLDINNWRYVIPYFTRDYRVVVMDLPSSGKSDTPDADYSMAFYSDYIYSFLRQKGIGDVTLIGLSLGAQIGVFYANRHPWMVKRLVLISPTGMRRRLGLLEDILIEFLVTEEHFAKLPDKDIEKFTRANFYDQGGICEELCRKKLAYIRHVKQADREKFYKRTSAFVRTLRNVLKESIRKNVKYIDAPTLIVMGERDALLDIDDAQYVYRSMKNARLVIIDQCGHQPNLESPYKLSSAIKDFLAQTSQSIHVYALSASHDAETGTP